MAVGIYVNDFRSAGITPPPPLVTGPFTLEEGLDDMMTRLKRGGELTTSGYCVGLLNLQDLENPEGPFERILYNAPTALHDFLAASCWSMPAGLEVGSAEHEVFIRERLLNALKIELSESQSNNAAKMPREDFLMAVGIAVENNGDLELFD